ncbi:MAG: vanadium-dependent haloperoxidase [Ginsengibacter sp.]
MKKIIFILWYCTVYSWASAQKNDNAKYLHQAQGALTTVLVHDVFSPPVASRVYLYSHAAAYEVIVHASKQDTYSSLMESIKKFPRIDPPAKPVNIELASMAAFYYTAGKFIFSEKMLRDSFKIALDKFTWLSKQNHGAYQASLQYARYVADTIIEWSNKDNYNSTRKIKRYSFSNKPGKWVPTPPAHLAAVEPYWYLMRTIAIDSSSQFAPPPEDFSTEKDSKFYKDAYEVYETGNTLNAEQKAMASFWDCNPFNVNTNGHLIFARKKLSPGAHWMNITRLCCKKINADLIKSSAAYILTAIALYDGFIGCWQAKYRDNLIRPETYINRYIDVNWNPLLQTPPFPEYTSGHSVISTSAAVVLGNFFGENFSFDDDTETLYGLPVRHFKSFITAANEAAISRLYGGIHFRDAISIGQTMGRQVGEQVLKKINLSNHN